MIFRRVVIAAIALLVMTPARAAADTLIIPFWGVNFGGDSGKTFSTSFESKQQTFGASAAFFGGGVVGIEADFGYSPDFFGKTDAGGSSVMTLVGNMMIAVPFGGQRGFGIRPYGLAGVGLLQSKADFPGLFDEGSSNSLAWNTGGGVLLFFGDKAGLRFDVRFFQSFDDVDTSGGAVDGPGKVEFTRGSIGFVFRF